MKIICTLRQQRYLQKYFDECANTPKVWDKCPMAFYYCPDTPVGYIKEEQCHQCLKDHIEWEITEDDRYEIEKLEDEEKGIDPKKEINGLIKWLGENIEK